MKNQLPWVLRAGSWSWPLAIPLVFGLASIPATDGRGQASQVLHNLASLVERLDSGDPAIDAEDALDGPKGFCTADFDLDGRADFASANIDGTITLYFGRGDGTFDGPLHVPSGGRHLREIVAADWTSDGRPDLAAASPHDGNVYVLITQAGREFVSGTTLFSGRSSRNLAAGDFDGDGRQDLAVAGSLFGVIQYSGLGNGEFKQTGLIGSLNFSDYIDFPKPVYSLKAWRFSGDEADTLIATHAETNLVWNLRADAHGALAVAGEVRNIPGRAHAIEVGRILHAASDSGARPDLITAEKFHGTVEIRRGQPGNNLFADEPAQILRVPGGPRAVQIVDLDGDGWNDLLVVLRNFDCVMAYRNEGGTLVAQAEFPAGSSPRELVAADFNGDQLPDAAVMNRVSEDISVLLNHPDAFGFAQSDLVYPACGLVAGLAVRDLNGDGRDDVLQLHRSSDDFSVWLARPDGSLEHPAYYPMGILPNAMVVDDINLDGHCDVITVNMGRTGIEIGSVSVRLGRGDGTFGPRRNAFLPSEIKGRLFALEAADFDGDGLQDLAAGFFDCRLAFFRGLPDGGFAYTHTHMFVIESRVMTVGDFDQDGDLDLAGAGYAGDVVVVENRGDLLTTTELTRQDYPPPSDDKFGTREIASVDVTGDGDPELIVGSGGGVMIYRGGEGMSFLLDTNDLPDAALAVSGAVTTDITGDGTPELIVTSRFKSCVKVLALPSDGPAELILSADIPAGAYLAEGDLDGDGLPDLVGTGGTLWTALSSRRSETVPPVGLLSERPGISEHPVLNEFLAVNNLIPLPQDGDRKSDWVELFNKTGADIPLSGWRLLWHNRADSPARTNQFVFPTGSVLTNGCHLVLVCEENLRSEFHTGFKLPGDGGVLCLISPEGTIVDQITYPAQFDNVSFGRYRDASHALAFNPYPSPGHPNVDNGPMEAFVDFEGFDPATLRPNQPIRFYAQGFHDAGIVSLSLIYQRRDVPNSNRDRVSLFDDGMHEDGENGDGWFAGLLSPGLPAGAEIEFYLEAVDLNEIVIVKPEDGIFAPPGQPVSLHSLAVGAAKPPLELSEIVAWNKSGLEDEGGGTPSWIEIRNGGTEPVALAEIGLSRNFFANRSRYVFAANTVLQPAEHRVLFADANPDQGPLHAPFELDRDGDEIWLTGLAPHGARLLIDHHSFASPKQDLARARLGWGGPWRETEPTPEAGNVAGSWDAMVAEDGNFVFGFPTLPGNLYQVERAGALPVDSWTSLPVIAGDGMEKTISEPLGREGYFRITIQSP